MSVVPMKLITLTGPLGRFDDLTRACVAGQPFQPENALVLLGDVTGLHPCDAANPYIPILRRLETLAGRMSVIVSDMPDDTPRTIAAAETRVAELETQYAALNDRRAALLRTASDKRTVIDRLENLRGISAHLEDLRSFQYLRFRYGHMPRETYDSFKDMIAAREDTFFFPTGRKPDEVYGVYITTRSAHDEVDSLFNSLHFARILIDEHADGSADEVIAALTAEIDTCTREAHDLELRLAALTAGVSGELSALHTWLEGHSAVRELRRYAAHAKETFYLTGWVPAADIPALTAAIDEQEELSYVTDDAADVTHVRPPTKLKNNFFARIYEPFLRMYGLPAYNETDPSLLMAVTYTLFFGIMFGDVGQGLCLALFGFILAHWKKMWLGNILVCCGLSGALFGCVYGSVFGFEHLLPGFKLLEGGNVTLLLVLSMGLGVLMIALSMCVNMWNGFRQKRFDKLLFGPNGLAGLVFYLGLIGMAVGAFTGYVNLMTPLYVLPVLVLPIVLIWFHQPLTALFSRRGGHSSVGEIIGTGFFEVFETLLSYLTNTLSFMRIGAYAITHVCLMQVVQMLAGSGNVVVLILGNLFVMGLEGLLVSIQVLRLEFYELFGRFYDDGGTEFRPIDLGRKSI